MIKHKKIIAIGALIIAIIFVTIISLTRYEFTSIEEIKLGTILLYEGATLAIGAIVILTMASRLRFYKRWNKFFVITISFVMVIALHLQTGAILLSNINIAEETTEDFVFSIIRLINNVGSMLFIGGFVLLNFLFPDKKPENARKIEES